MGEMITTPVPEGRRGREGEGEGEWALPYRSNDSGWASDCWFGVHIKFNLAWVKATSQYAITRPTEGHRCTNWTNVCEMMVGRKIHDHTYFHDFVLAAPNRSLEDVTQ